jgi:hypothetical protein
MKALRSRVDYNLAEDPDTTARALVLYDRELAESLVEALPEALRERGEPEGEAERGGEAALEALPQ